MCTLLSWISNIQELLGTMSEVGVQGKPVLWWGPLLHDPQEVLRRRYALLCLKMAHLSFLWQVNAAVKLRRLGKQYETWTAEDWNKVMFSKESPLQQFVMPKRILGRIGKRFDEQYIFQSRQQPPSQMICGTRSKYGTAGLCYLPPEITINGVRYIDLLVEKHQRIIFMHDGASWHWSKFVQNFYNRINVTTLGWPGNITDLNPIKNS